MLLLQFVLERITGRTLDVLIADGITRPLGMTATSYGPRPEAAATEHQRRPWAKADRGMLRGVVHDENAWALGGIAGHAGLFSTGPDLAVFCRALLAGGAYGPARILGPDFVELLLTPPGLGFALDQPWFMGTLSGQGRRRPHGLHRHVPGPGPGDGHLPRPAGEHGPPGAQAARQPPPGGTGEPPGQSGTRRLRHHAPSHASPT